MIKECTDQVSIFTDAEIKATLNTIIIPFILTMITSNIAIGLCWILMLTVIYKYIQRQKVENAKMFFHFLKILILAAIGMFAILSLFIV